MDERKTTTLDAETISTLGTIAGGVAGVGLAHQAHKNDFLGKILNPQSDFHEMYHYWKEYLDHRGEEMDEVEQLIRKSNGTVDPHRHTTKRAKTYVDRYTQIMDDVDTMRATPEYQLKLEQLHKSKTYQPLAQAKEALDTLYNDPKEIESVTFSTRRGKPVTTLEFYPTAGVNTAGRLMENEGAARTLTLRGVGADAAKDLTVYTHGGTQKLLVTDIEHMHASEWYKAAEQAVETLESKIVRHERKILKSVAGSEWITKHAGPVSPVQYINFAAGGMLIGGVVAAAVTGIQKHRHKVTEKRQQEAAAATLPGIF